MKHVEEHNRFNKEIVHLVGKQNYIVLEHSEWYSYELNCEVSTVRTTVVQTEFLLIVCTKCPFPKDFRNLHLSVQPSTDSKCYKVFL